MTASGLIVAIIAISVLIIVHEAGHYFVAKWCSMRVERFSLGFGPAVLGKRYKGTLFQIAPIPFGGFVEIQGMNIIEEVDPDDVHAYPNRPVWQRFLVIFAGPATNFLFAVLLAFVLYSTAGIKNGNVWTLVDDVEQGFDAEGKLQSGDRIVTLQRPGDAQPIEIFEKRQQIYGPDLAQLVHESGGQPMKITVLRKGELVPLEVKAAADTSRKVVYREGRFTVFALKSGEDPQNLAEGESLQYRLGIRLMWQEERGDVGFFTAAGEAIYYPIRQTQQIYHFIKEMIEGKQEGRLTGPVGIAKTISKAVEYGWIVALSWFMMINVWLGLVNLLPLPALDGGRLVFLVYEMATRRRANPKIEATVHMVGIMLLLLLMVAVTYNDCTSDFP